MGENVADKNAILGKLVHILEEMSSEWEMGFSDDIGPQTRLIADLAFNSINFVQLAAAIEEHFRQNDLPFQSLIMADDYVVDDLKVSDLVDFLYTHLNKG